MITRVLPSQAPRPRPSSRSVDLQSRRLALARAEKHAAVALAQADDAALKAMHPIARAEVLRDRACKADMQAARLRHDLFVDQELPPAQPNPSPADARQRQISDAVTAASDRAVQLHQLARIAAKSGLHLDAQILVASGISLASARENVMNALAEASEGLVISCRPTCHSAEASNSAAGWSAALAKVAARRGTTL